jgi:acyl-CoA synthetase
MRSFLTLHQPRQAKAHYDAGLWLPETFYQLLARGAEHSPEAHAIRDAGRRLTWLQLQCWVDAVAEDLRSIGLVPGDRVSNWTGNRIEAVVVFLACARNGYACNPSLHRTQTPGEVRDLLGAISSRVLLSEPGWGGGVDLDAVLADLPALQRIYRPDDLHAPLSAPSQTPVWDDPDTVRYLAFTSGTTGAPKCVMHSDNTLMANARDLVRDWNHSPRTKLMTLSPLSHHIAWVAVGQWLAAGCELILDDPPPPLSRLDWIEQTGATYVMGVPTHAMDILSEQQRRGHDRLGSVEVFYMAGAPIPPSVAEAFVKQGIKPQNVYGMTENSSHQYTYPDDDTATIISTCGRGGPGYEIKIFDSDNPDREVPVGTVGQIGGRGAALMLGYFGNQKATEESFNRHGWFLSGDLGALDETGNLRIEGRLKDLIIRGGHNIYPSHIEALALRHRAVDKVAVFPVPDQRLGEKACIAVIGDIGSSVLLRHLSAEGLSKYDMPEYFLEVEAFPLTASGKILKRELVQMVKDGRIRPQPIRYRDNMEDIA